MNIANSRSLVVSVALLVSLAIPLAMRADELDDLKSQMQSMQKTMEQMQKKIAQLEEENHRQNQKQAAVAKTARVAPLPSAPAEGRWEHRQPQARGRLRSLHAEVEELHAHCRCDD